MCHVLTIWQFRVIFMSFWAAMKLGVFKNLEIKNEIIGFQQLVLDHLYPSSGFSQNYKKCIEKSVVAGHHVPF